MFIVANWKMNGKLQDVEHLTNILQYIENCPNINLVLCIPATLINCVFSKCSIINKNHVFLGAQDAHWQISGAYTGDISAEMLYDCGARYVILGHCERRKYHLESNELIAKKMQASLAASLKTIICVGETLDEKANSLEIINKQLLESLSNITLEKIEKGFLTIAYEPVWAIGSGQIPNAADIEKIHKHIKSLLENLYGVDLAKQIKIIYGGSINKENAYDIINTPGVDGLLVGGASLKTETFIPLIQSVEKNYLEK